MRLKRVLIAAAAAAGLQMTPVHASELHIGFTLDPLTLDPANHRSRETESVLRTMYNGLVAHGPNMELVPELAESWKWIDPQTMEVKLRSGVKFHSGATMTADDVVYSFTRLLKPGAIGGKTSPRKGLLGPVTDVVKVDEHTVRFVLSAPWPVLPAMLTFQEVVNKDFTEKTGADGMATHEDGTGPYTMTQWRRGDSLVLQRFPGYFGGAPAIPSAGKACAERVIIKIIPENASRVAALLSGDVDIINELPAHDIRTVEANPNTRVAAVNGTRTFFVALNNNRPPFNDVRVRQAANHALNRKLIIDKLLNGRAVALNGVMSPAAFGFNAKLPEYAYDVKQARALLAAAGHPNGIDVTLDADGPQKDTAEAIASLLTQAGIRTKVAVGEGSQVRAKWANGGKREGDMWITSWGNGSLDPTDIFEPTLMTGGRGNSAGYSSKQVDTLLAEGGRETDTAKRAAFYEQAQSIVHADAPWIFLWLPQDLYGTSAKLTGWKPAASGWLNLRDACVH
ncbi:MAG: peptide ABC transporter substrate-binding protein [Rhodospirillales bacterium 70-18]|nr:ABC transporter substrate-binding protein [Rhodospirillales bacterium]OJY65726.1 MAG: peptide ABC transporter substrate-binding protein [Rhodospirillales bacterium 70-18]